MDVYDDIKVRGNDVFDSTGKLLTVKRIDTINSLPAQGTQDDDLYHIKDIDVIYYWDLSSQLWKCLRYMKTFGDESIDGIKTFTDIPVHPSIWRDLTGDISGAKLGANAPSWDSFVGGISHYAFSASQMKEIQASYHVQHDWDNTTPMYVHIHWSPSSTASGTVRWGFEITKAKGYGRGAFTTTNTIYVEQSASGVDRDHLIAECDVSQVIAAADLEVDGVITIRAFRDADHANDTYPDKVFGIFCDLHYQTKFYGTWQKNYPFYTKP